MAAQSFLKEGGHHELLQQMLMMIQQMSHSLEAVKKDVRSTTVTLGSLAMDELDCPRLVFIMPHTAEQRTFTQRLKSGAAASKHRLIFIDPVTGSAVPCGADGKGYVLALPSDFLRKHAAHLSDGRKWCSSCSRSAVAPPHRRGSVRPRGCPARSETRCVLRASKVYFSDPTRSMREAY